VSCNAESAKYKGNSPGLKCKYEDRFSGVVNIARPTKHNLRLWSRLIKLAIGERRLDGCQPPRSALAQAFADRALRCFAYGDEPLRDRAVAFAAGQEDGEKTPRASCACLDLRVAFLSLRGLRRAPRTQQLEIVFGGPAAAGQSHPRQPRFTTGTMPPMTIPPTSVGESGLIRFHCASLSHNKFLAQSLPR
jgi:hypothetical protein